MRGVCCSRNRRLFWWAVPTLLFWFRYGFSQTGEPVAARLNALSGWYLEKRPVELSHAYRFATVLFVRCGCGKPARSAHTLSGVFVAIISERKQLISIPIRKCLLHPARICAVVSVLLWLVSQFAVTGCFVQADSPVCRIQVYVVPQGVLLMRSPHVGEFSVSVKSRLIGNDRQRGAGGIFWDGGSVSFFGRWPVKCWLEPSVFADESVFYRAGFVTVRHWLIVLVFAAIYLSIRFVPVGDLCRRLRERLSRYRKIHE